MTWQLNGMVLRADGVHFTPDASRRLAPVIAPRLRASGVWPGQRAAG